MDSIRRCSWTPRTRAGKQEHETARQAVLSVPGDDALSYMVVGLVSSDLDITVATSSAGGVASCTASGWVWAADGLFWHNASTEASVGAEWPHCSPTATPWTEGDILVRSSWQSVQSSLLTHQFLRNAALQGLEYDADANTLEAFKKEEGRWVAKGLLAKNLPCTVHHWMVELWSTGDRVRIARQDAAFVS